MSGPAARDQPRTGDRRSGNHDHSASGSGRECRPRWRSSPGVTPAPEASFRAFCPSDLGRLLCRAGTQEPCRSPRSPPGCSSPASGPPRPRPRNRRRPTRLQWAPHPSPRLLCPRARALRHSCRCRRCPSRCRRSPPCRPFRAFHRSPAPRRPLRPRIPAPPYRPCPAFHRCRFPCPSRRCHPSRLRLRCRCRCRSVSRQRPVRPHPPTTEPPRKVVSGYGCQGSCQSTRIHSRLDGVQAHPHGVAPGPLRGVHGCVGHLEQLAEVGAVGGE
jgi:hypothetical protein